MASRASKERREKRRRLRQREERLRSQPIAGGTSASSAGLPSAGNSPTAAAGASILDRVPDGIREDLVEFARQTAEVIDRDATSIEDRSAALVQAILGVATACAHDADGRILLYPNYFTFYKCVDELYAGVGPITTIRTFESTLSPQAQTRPALVMPSLATVANSLDEAIREKDPEAPDEETWALLHSLKLINAWVSYLPSRAQEYFRELSALGGRALDVADEEARDGEPDENGEADLSELPQAAVRMAFFAAMNARRDKEAFKLLGALRAKAHDTRELAYLESLAYLSSGDYTGAVANARRVKTGDTDYVMAQGVALESLCYMGASEPALELLQRNLGPLEGSPSFAAYVGLVLLSHVDPSEVRACADRLRDIRSLIPEPGVNDPDWPLYHSWACRLGWELSSLREERRLATLASEEDLTPRLREARLQAAITLEPMAAVVGESAAETARAMSRRLLHPEGHVSPQEAVTALHLLFAAGAYQEFVDEALLWLGAFDGRFGLPEHSDVFHVLSMCWTLTQGVVEHRNMVKTVGERWGWSPPCDDPAEIEGLVPPFAMRLSPMAALAYNSASRALARMTKEEEGWADAGMVSLGFFRILELEMNRAVFHVQESREPPDGLVRAIQEWLEHNPYDGLSKRQRQSRRQWTFVAESLASALRRANGRPPSMELGPLEALLLRCTKRDDGGSWDAEPRTGLDTFVSAGLTAEGSLALRDGRLAALIRPELRERYRNPPAHSRYLPLRVAVECKAYIDESLGELLQWIDG